MTTVASPAASTVTASRAADVRRRLSRDARYRAAVASRIPAPDWRARAECLRYDPEVFFPNAAEDHEPAVDVCARCPVVGACLATALDSGECDGVWGGTTPEERRVMREAWTYRPTRTAARA